MNKNKKQLMLVPALLSNFSHKVGINKTRLCSLTLASILMVFALISTANAAPYAYITNNADNTVSVIDIATNSVTATVPVGLGPIGVAVSPDGTKAYVANHLGNTVSVINATDNSVTATVPVGVNPHGVAANAEGTYVYVTNSGSSTVSVIDTATNIVTATVPVGALPYGIAVSPDGAKVYVTNSVTNDVSIIDTATNIVTATVPFVGVGPYGVAVNADGTKAYVTNSGLNTVSVIDTATNIVTAIVPVGVGPYGVAVNADGTKVYVANHIGNTVSVIDTATNLVTATVNGLSDPHGVAVNADGTNAYVANHAGNTVSVIDTTTNLVTATVPVGNSPVALGRFIGPFPAYSMNKTITDIAGKGPEANVTVAGNVITYLISVTNDGDVNLTNVSFDDPLIGTPELSESIAANLILEPEEVWNYTGTYTVLQEDINDNGDGDGIINNTATVDCDELGPINASAGAQIDQTPFLVNKTIIDVAGNGPEANVTADGDIITYQIKLTNYGGLPFKLVSVYDSLSMNTFTGPMESGTSNKILDPGEYWTYTGTYTVNQSDLNNNGTEGNGFINNTATAYFYGGVKPNDEFVGSNSSSAAVPVEQNPSCTVNKTVTDVAGKGAEANVTVAGNVISYEIYVNNTGNLDLTNVIVSDPLLSNLTGPSGDDSFPGVLNVGENWTYIGNYTVTQEDIDNNGNFEGEGEAEGIINNTVTVDCDELDSISDSAEVQIDQTPYLVNKTVIDVGGKGPLANATKAGEVITYLINLTNYGGLPFKPVSVHDSLIPLTGPSESGASNKILDSGENWTFIGTYTVNQSDLNNNGGGDGFINNTATAFFYGGVKPDNGFVGSRLVSAAVQVEQNPAYSINKTVLDVAGNGSEANATAAGDVISYQINVTNTGNIDLENVNVSDPLTSLEEPTGDTEDVGILNVGESWIYNASYTVTQEDLNTKGEEDGFINNTATVDCDLLDPKNDSAEVPLEWNPAYSINKTVIDVAGNGSEANATWAGDVITYQINVTNDGNIDLTNVNVSDPLISLEEPIGDEEDSGILNVGETWNYTGTYSVTQADLNSNGDGDGFINNTASIVCDQLEMKSSGAAVQVEQNPAYGVNKTVTDVAGNGSEANVTLVGDEITYEINVTNDGNIDLTNVNVSDSLASLDEVSGDDEDEGILNVGENWICTVTYNVTTADMNSNGGGDKFINNTVTIACDQLDPENASAAVPIEQNPAYTVNKSVVDVAGNGSEANVTYAGNVISYQVDVTNDGNIGLNNLSAVDPLSELSSPSESITADGLLELGETWTYYANYTVTQADLNSNGDGDGFINNTVMVDCNELEPENDSAAVFVEQHPAYSVDKMVYDVAGKGPESNVTSASDRIIYLINVTNDGNIDLTNVSANDSLIDHLKGPYESYGELFDEPAALPTYQGSGHGNGILEVGETWTYAGIYEVTQSDLNSNGDGDGFINNTATVDCDKLDPINDSAEVPVEQIFDCSLYKSVIGVDKAGDGMIDKAGDVIDYRIALKNDGNVDLSNISVNDSLINITGPEGDDTDSGILNVEETWIYFGSYTVTQEDIDNCTCNGGGFIENTATVSIPGLPDESSGVQQPVLQSKSLMISKSLIGVDTEGDYIANRAGDIIEYQIAIKNNGKVDLSGISVYDSLMSLTGPVGDDVSPGVLSAGETWKYTGNYTVTQEDLESNGGGDGDIDNTATVHCSKLCDRTSSVSVPIFFNRNTVTNGSSGSNTTNGTDDDSGVDDDDDDDSGSSSGGSSGSSSGSSGGAGGSPEPAKNVEVKEISQAFVTSGNSVKFNFPKNATSVTSITFDSKKTAGKTTTIVEMLKGKSTLVSELPSGEVYKSFNIWVGNSGFATSKNIENAVIGFKVEKFWLQDKGIDSSSIFLNRYSDDKWNELPVSLLGEDDTYLYFTAETPGFSPFSITAKTTAKAGNEIKSESGTEDVQENSGSTGADVEQQTENEGNTSTPEESTNAPGFEVIYGIAGLLVVFLYRRR